MIQKLATNMPPMLVELNDVLKLSMYTLNKVGDSIIPCFTPLDTQKRRRKLCFPILRTFVGVSTNIQVIL